MEHVQSWMMRSFGLKLLAKFEFLALDSTVNKSGKLDWKPTRVIREAVG